MRRSSRAAASTRSRRCTRRAPRPSRSRRSRPTRCAFRASPTASCCWRWRSARRSGRSCASTPRTTTSSGASRSGSRPRGAPIRWRTPTPGRPWPRTRRSAARSSSACATGARTHLCHVSLERGFALVGHALGDGADATAETCTHYLVMDEDDLRRLGGRAKINPPLRPRAQQDALWRLLDAGRVDQVTSDHVGWARELKDTPDIFAARSGVPGLETTLPLLFSEGVVRRGLPLGTLLQVLCSGPGGALRPGAAQGSDRARRRCRPRDLRSRRALAHRRAGARVPGGLEPVPWAGRDRAGQAGARARRHRLRGGEVRGRAGSGQVVRPVRKEEAS